MLSRTLRSSLPSNPTSSRLLVRSLTTLPGRPLSSHTSTTVASANGQHNAAPARTKLNRQLHGSAMRRSEVEEPNTRPEIDTPPSLYNFTEEEEMLRDTGESCFVLFSLFCAVHLSCKVITGQGS